MVELGKNNALFAQTRAVLEWYQLMGVDCAVDETPKNWLKTGGKPDLSVLQKLISQQSTSPSSPLSPSAISPTHTAPPSHTTSPQHHLPNQALSEGSESISQAKQCAAKANSLGELKEILAAFEGCSLKRTAKNFVFYRGSEQARLMVIGEAPGRDEDIQGKPFVGRAGQLLDKMLAAINLCETDVHITNIVYWRPPGNRTPTLEEGKICRPFLSRQINLVAPDYILFMGGFAAKQLLNTSTGIMKLRGKWQNFENDGQSYTSLPTLHPSYLLRTPLAKKLAWQDLKLMRQALDGAKPNI